MQLTTECKAAESCFLNKLWGRYQACRPVYSKGSFSPSACQCLCTYYSLRMGPSTPCWHRDLLNSSTTPGLSLNSPQKLGHFQDFSKYLLCCKINSLSPEAIATFLVTSEFSSLSSHTSLTQTPHLFVSDSTFSLKLTEIQATGAGFLSHSCHQEVSWQQMVLGSVESKLETYVMQ